ncbi:DUF4184 family protein [Rhodopirellula europaea]|uniref:Putative membrane protein n=1 Tax=Rhodopirellula europaea 6C TaxID=1263867 RepID=M2AP45_9BACT|nr:DUF4184 family protein [Rhodopirellula europaea]EMB14472.1 putative membrane protein [Rhodopirellula europaea 6C]
MPFTPTHVAAAIPIAWMAKWRLPFSALAIGCMVPDAGVFFPMLFDYESFHSIRGLFIDCVPVGVAAYFVYHLLIKQPAVELLPGPLRTRVRPIADRPVSVEWQSILLVAICVLVGASTHVFWDSFTHQHRWGSMIALPFLSSEAFSLSDRSVRWYAVAQHLSSLFLLPPMGVFALRWLWKQPEGSPEPKRTRIPDLVTLSVMAVASLMMLVHASWVYAVHSDYGVAFALRQSVMIFGALMLIALVLYSVVMHAIWSRAETSSDQ